MVKYRKQNYELSVDSDLYFRDDLCRLPYSFRSTFPLYHFYDQSRYLPPT